MKRVALLLVAAIILITQCIAQSGDDIVHIPDTAFLYALIDEGVDTNEDSLISYNEAESVVDLIIWNSGITDLTGIEAFVRLEALACDGNNIRTLNLPALPDFFLLSIDGNPIDSLDLSNQPNLTHLYASDCNLTFLNISNNPALQELWSYTNNLSAMDVSANVNLKDFVCSENKLEILDVSNNLRLNRLMCDTNPLDSLDLSRNDSLEILACRGDSLTSLILPDSSALRRLECNVNFLESIDITGCPDLEYFVCDYNNITSLDVTKNPLLNWLSCEFNQLTSLDVSNNPELNLLWCGDNQLSSLDLSQNSKIGSIPEEWDNLGLENMPSLTEVCVWDGFPGDATISIDGSPNICWDSVSCDGLCPSGIEGFNQSDLTIYPNPTSDILTIETTGFGPHTIRLHTLNGREIYAATFTGNSHQIDLSSFRKGMYFLSIRNEDWRTTRKIVKQ